MFIKKLFSPLTRIVKKKLLKMISKQDKILVERIKSGADSAAEAELLSRYNDRIARFVYAKLGRNNKFCDDVINESKMATLISLREGKFDTSRGTKLGSYIFGITINKIKDYLTYQNRQTESENEYATDSKLTIDFVSDLEEDENILWLKDILSSLDVKYQEVLYLKFYDGLSIANIGKKIGLHPKKVSDRIHYALKKIKKNAKNKKSCQYFGLFL